MNRLRIAAVYEVLAGLVGLAFTLHPTALPNGGAITFNIFAVALALASVAAGVLTWTGIARARQVSLVFQLLQVPRLTSSALVLALLVGVEGTVRFQGPLVSIFTTTGVTLVALLPSEPRATVIGINLVAALVAGLLWSERITARAEHTGPENLVLTGARRDGHDEESRQ